MFDCAEAQKHLQALRQKIQSAGLYERAPLELHERVRASLRQGSQADRIVEAEQVGRAVKPGQSSASCLVVVQHRRLVGHRCDNWVSIFRARCRLLPKICWLKKSFPATYDR